MISESHSSVLQYMSAISFISFPICKNGSIAILGNGGFVVDLNLDPLFCYRLWRFFALNLFRLLLFLPYLTYNLLLVSTIAYLADNWFSTIGCYFWPWINLLLVFCYCGTCSFGWYTSTTVRFLESKANGEFILADILL